MFFLHHYLQEKKKYQTCSYEIKSHYKNNIYSINLQNKKGEVVWLKTSHSKEYFVVYKSHLYFIKDNFALEKTSLMETAKFLGLRSIIYKKLLNYEGSYRYIQKAILLGIKNIPEAILFKTTGTWHLLCVGGLHMNILKNILDIIFNFLGEFFKNMRLIRGIFVYVEILFLWFYAYISDFHIPALRSLSMSSCHFFFYLKGFSIPNLSVFFMVLFLFLIYNPYYLWHMGFQMSFLSVYFLIAFSPLCQRWLNLYTSNYLKYILNLCIMNCGISLLLVPFSFCFHGYYNLLSPLCNMITIPIFSCGLLFSFLGIFQIYFWHN